MPINDNQQNSYYCSKLRAAYKEMGGTQAISGPWSNSNCYLFYNKSFESQSEAEKFCRYAFGAEYRGELAFGIGISNFSPLKTNENNGKNPYHGIPGWKYLKMDILSEDSICIFHHWTLSSGQHHSSCVSRGSFIIGLPSNKKNMSSQAQI